MPTQVIKVQLTKMTVTKSGEIGLREERRKVLKVKMRRKPRSQLPSLESF